METKKRNFGQAQQILSHNPGCKSRKQLFSEIAAAADAPLCFSGAEEIRVAKQFAPDASSVSSFFQIRQKAMRLFSKSCCLTEIAHPIYSFIYSLYPQMHSLPSPRYILKTTSDL